MLAVLLGARVPGAAAEHPVFAQSNSAPDAALTDDARVVPPPGAAPLSQWQLIWGDEFDGTALDTTRWRIEDLHLIKNAELQYYAPDEVYIENGCLVLRSRQRSYSGYDNAGDWRHFDYTSGLVETRDRFATAYGRIEVRARLPATRGLWPAHWLLPDSRRWPPEIDIMELLGHEPTRVYMTHHWGQWPDVQRAGNSYSGLDFSQGFHTFAIEWSPARIDWYIDGMLRFSSVQDIPREPFYIILNTAVGGDWPGNPDASSVFPQYHRIDYVRAYMPGDPGAALLDVEDATPQTATVDGVIGRDEYVLVTTGINAGLLDQIGRNSEMHVDSSADGRLSIGFASVTAWPGEPYGVVIYVDSVDGGFASTYELTDAAARSRRLASGKGESGQRADLYFAPGFRADYAVVLEVDFVTIYRLDRSSHVLIHGAALDAPTDMLGGDDVRYRADGDGGRRVRECELRLSHVSVAPGQTFRCVVTLLNGDTAFRANEFVGAAPGNPFDAAGLAATAAVLKPGDFIRFRAASPADGCGPGCSAAGGNADLDGDCDVDSDDLARLLAGYGTQAGATHAQGDVDLDRDVELDDLASLLRVYGAACP